MDTLSIASRVLQVLLTIIVSLIVLVYVQDWQYKKLRNGLNQKLRSVQLPWGWQYEAIVIPPMVDYTNASSLSEPHRYVVKGMLVQNRDGKWLIELTYPKRHTAQHNIVTVDEKSTLFRISTTDTSMDEAFPVLLKALKNAGFDTLVVVK
jgi:hypothetical protein